MGDARDVVAQATQAVNDHNEEALAALYSPDAVLEAPDARLEGLDAVVGYTSSWLRAFPDAKLTVHNEVSSGDLVAHEFIFEGTHTAPLASPQGEIPATGKRLRGRGADVFRVQNGKIVEEHLYFDQVEVMTQLGLMPETASI